MKKRITEIILTLVILALPGMAQAALEYYSFEGTVSAFDTSPTIDFQNQVFSAVFAVNFETEGCSTDLNGARTVHIDETTVNGNRTTTTDYFYSELIYTNFNQMVGTTPTYEALGANTTLRFEFSEQLVFVHYFGDLSGASYNGTTHGTSDSSFSVSLSAGSFVQHWNVGESYGVYLESSLPRNSVEKAWGDLTLTAISDTMPSPVPIPGAIWLLGSGLVGLVGLKRRFPVFKGLY